MISTNNRRDLFQGIFNLISDSKSIESVSDRKEFVLGKVNDFPMGEKKLLPKLELYVETLAEGIRVQSNKNSDLFYRVYLNQRGELLVDFSKIWPAHVVFSMLTNEPIPLIKN